MHPTRTFRDLRHLAAMSGMMGIDMTGRAEGFEYVVIGASVEIRHHGRKAATLRNAAAATFLTDVEGSDPQRVMARVTGNYKRGNERSAHRRG